MAPLPARQLTPQEMATYSNLLVGLAKDPNYRHLIAPLIAKKYPEHATAFNDVAVANQIHQLRREIQTEKANREIEKFTEAQEGQRKELVKSGRYTDEQTKEIKAVMDRYHIDDYNAGAVLYSHEKAPDIAAPPLPEERPGATWEFPSVEGRDGKPIPFADFMKDPTAAARNAAYTVISQFRNSRLPAQMTR